MGYGGKIASRSGDVRRFNFTGNGSNTAFDLGFSPATQNQLIITINGVVQHYDAFSVSGSVVTFTGTPAAGDYIQVTAVVDAIGVTGIPDGAIANVSSLKVTTTPVLIGNAVGTFSNPIIQAASTANSWIQINAQNLNNGNNASTDAILARSDGNDNAGYIDMGINSNTYAQAAYSIMQPNSGYLFVNGGDLVVGTQTAHNIILHTGNTTSASERVRVVANGNVGIACNSPSSLLTVAGNITAAGNVVAASVNYVAGHPLSIKGCMTWIDLDQSYNTDYPFHVRDLGNIGLSWVMRSQNSAGYRDCSTVSAPGTTKRVLKTGTTTDAGIIGCSTNRSSRVLYDQPNTMVIWAWHSTSAIASNESLVTQYNTVNGNNYQIIRGYPSNWEFYNNGASQSQLTYTNTGGYNTGAWSMFAFVMGYNGTLRVYKYNQSNQTGVYDQGTFTQSWVWDGTAGSRAMFIGGSEWGSNSGEPWGIGSTGGTGNGYIGPFMWYSTAVTQTELTSLFNYYKSSFSIT